MPRAVRFDHYGGVEVLKVVDVERPVAGEGQVARKGQGGRDQSRVRWGSAKGGCTSAGPRRSPPERAATWPG